MFLSLMLIWACLFGFSQETDLLTHYEKSGYLETADYEEVIRYSELLAEKSPQITYQTFGVSPQGRQLPLLIVDKDGLSNPFEIKNTGRIILLIEAGIHPGEADGTDAALMFVRDVTLTGKLPGLLENISMIVIPAFNVDGLARFGPFNRINQNGPKEMGWRANAQNLNLNRDFLKADAPEMQSWLKMFNYWLPDFFIDCHATDGADYEYVATYMMEIFGNMDEGLTAWQRDEYLPCIVSEMDDSGYPVFPYVSFRRWHDPRSGLVSEAAPPRLSQGYSAIQNRPGLLIETHMLKPHRLRVEANYHFMRLTSVYLNENGNILKDLLMKADEFVSSPEFRKDTFALRFHHDENDSSMVEFRGVEYTMETSDLTGGNWFKYSGKPEIFTLPWFNKPVITHKAILPEAYIIPPEWTEIIQRLPLHGIDYRLLASATEIEVSSYRFTAPQWSRNPYEGRHPLQEFESEIIIEKRIFPAGSVVIDMNQRTARVIANILEPRAPDSYLYWGFFDAIFEQKEYSETYVMEVMAREMLANDPDLKEEFEKWKQDNKNFAQNQWLQLNWFYSKTPYWDWKMNKYPVGKIFSRNILEVLNYQ